MQAANLPSQEGLNSLYGDWNPMAYMQGMQNQDIASQFRQQGFQSNANDLDKQSLENQQAALMNPELLAKQRYANVEAGLTAERNVAQRQNNLDADDRAAVLKMSADEFAKFGNDATRLAISSNPAEQKHGQELLALLPAAQAERRKAADAMALQKEQTRAHLAGINAQGATALKLEQNQYEHGKYVKAGPGSLTFVQSLMKQRVPERLGTIGALVATGRTPDGTPLTDDQMEFYQNMFNQDVRTTDGANWVKAQGITTAVDADGNVKIVNKKPGTVAPTAPEKELTIDEKRKAL